MRECSIEKLTKKCPRERSMQSLVPVIALVTATISPPPIVRAPQTNAFTCQVDCPSDSTITGYTSIADINADMARRGSKNSGRRGSWGKVWTEPLSRDIWCNRRQQSMTSVGSSHDIVWWWKWWHGFHLQYWWEPWTADHWRSCQYRLHSVIGDNRGIDL